MAKLTPPLYASGKWVLRAPWSAAPDVTYVCHAIRTFEDIEKLAQNCRFRDCQHHKEPGCAVREALRAGTLEAGRLASYEKLKREQAIIERRAAYRQSIIEKRGFHASDSGTAAPRFH